MRSIINLSTFPREDHWPQWVSGASQVLFGIWGGPRASNVLLTIETGDWVSVLPHPTGARYLPGGHLVVGGYETAELQAVAFDPSDPIPTVAQTSILDDVFWYRNDPRSWFDVSRTGTLVYVPGDPAQSELVWVSRNGEVEPLSEGMGLYEGVAVSGDGTRLAFGLGADVWVRDLQRRTTTRVTFEGPANHTFLGAWTPDGRLAFSANRSGTWELYATRVDGTGSLELLLEREFEQHVNSVSRDGVVAFSEINPTTGLDLWTLAPSADPAPFANTPFNEQQGRFSPDGRFIAYVSDESGRNEVYVRPYPGPGERVTVSDAGGVNPLWSRAGDELFYREGDDLTAVPVQTSPTLELGEPVRVMDVGAFQPSGDVNPTIAIAPDGERFLMVRKPPGARGQINVVLNWDKELRERVPLP